MAYLEISHRILRGLALAACLLALVPPVGWAATFTVNSTADAVDANPGDGICATVGGECTLRAAVMEANALLGPDVIILPLGIYVLAIPGSGENAAATGDLDITDDLTITGGGADRTIIDGGKLDRVFEIVSSTSITVNISGVTIHNGLAGPAERGGGICNWSGTLTIRNCIISGNEAIAGGGIANYYGSVTLIDSTVSGNTGSNEGGGIDNAVGTLILEGSAVSGNRAITGGGIQSYNLTVINSTISGNTATWGGGVVAWAGTATISASTINSNSVGESGGGIRSSANLTITNSTVSSNSATRGGGIEIFSSPQATVTNCTITNNGADAGGNIISSGTLNLLNTVVANSTSGGNCSGSGISSLGHNLDSGATCGFTAPSDLANTDPMLGPLEDEGGPTFTHALLPGSPAIDAGSNDGCPATDQRGAARPIDGNGDGIAVCDIGAYEAPSPEQLTLSGIFPSTGGDTGTASVVLHGSGFKGGATVKLVSGGSEVIGNPVSVAADGRTIAATFDLAGKARGLWDLVLTNPDGASATLAQSFTIEEGRPAQLWVDVLGPTLVLAGRQATYRIAAGNEGNVDLGGLAFVAVYVPPGIPEVTVKFNETTIGTFVPQPASPHALVGIFNLPWLSAGGSAMPYSVRFVPPPGLTGNIELYPMHLRDHVGDALYVLLRTKMIELHIEPPPLDELFVQAFEKALEDTLEDWVKKLAIEGIVEPIWAKHDESIREAVDKALDTLETPYSAAVQAYRAAWNLMTDPANWSFFESATHANYQVLPKPPAPPDFPSPEVTKPVEVVASFDPNGKSGPTGIGTAAYLSGARSLGYSIFFENQETATAPAQQVVITDQLNTANMNLNTFSLGPFAFGEKLLNPPPGSSDYARLVDLRPANDLIVNVQASLNKATGLLTWRFTSIDPTTGLPPTDPLAGFLPPNVTPPEGQGSVLFTVKPKEGLDTGTEIRNQASIVFDVNPPVLTPQWFNTLDNSKPTSQVKPLAPTQTSSDFAVEWSGSDEGSGIADFTIYVSEDGGPFSPWLSQTPDTSATFTGQPGHNYAFYSLARDLTGNVENAKTAGEATTAVSGARVSLSTASLTFASQPVGSSSTPQPVTLTNPGNATLTIMGITASGDFTQTNSCGTTVAAGGNCTINVTFTPTATGTRNATLTITDNAADSPQTVSLTGTGIPPSIAISSVNPSSVTLVRGGSAQSVTVNLTRSGYAGSVTLSTSALPSGVSATFTQPGTGNSGSISLKAASNATLVSNRTITITASGSGVSSVTAAFSLTVNPPSIAISSVGPSSVTLTRGGSSQKVTVKITRTSFTGSVKLSTSALPSGVSATFTQPGTGNSGSISLKAASNATVVTGRSITITARGSGVSSVTATFTLTT